MKKTDLSIKKVSIATIKRHTIKPFDFKYSVIYENDRSLENEKVKSFIKLEDSEELICSVILSNTIWSVLTSRRRKTVVLWMLVKKYQIKLNRSLQNIR